MLALERLTGFGGPCDVPCGCGEPAGGRGDRGTHGGTACAEA